jgi:muramoyltetrapeptide carboxypeptidase
MTLPAKLSPGDEVRIIAPSTSLAIISPAVRAAAVERLESLSLRVSFSANCEEIDEFSSSSIASRLDDIHTAFADPNVRGILTAIGGYSSNQLLAYLDFELIAANPKILCGYSDITALGCAIYARTGLVTYSGPHFSTFGMKQGLEYTLEHFRKCLFDEGAYDVQPSGAWSDDPWYQDQEKRTFIPNPGMWVINPGQAQGKLLGGNLCTLNLLQGTPYMPELAGSILMLEDDEESYPEVFDRDLQSLIHQPGFEQVQGLAIGRFQNKSQMTPENLGRIIQTKAELALIPVAAGADFGHTTPQLTFPTGGSARLTALEGEGGLTILEH